MTIVYIEKENNSVQYISRQRENVYIQEVFLRKGKKNMSTEKKSMMDKILEKVDVIAGPMTKFGQIPFVRGIVNGMVAALPGTMVGSLI